MSEGVLFKVLKRVLDAVQKQGIQIRQTFSQDRIHGARIPSTKEGLFEWILVK